MNKVLRWVWGVALGVMAISAGWADTIKLSDGRVLREASVMSETARTVMIRHDGGLVSVEKSKLPATLQAKYPERGEPAPAPVSTPASVPSAPAVATTPPSTEAASPAARDTSGESPAAIRAAKPATPVDPAAPAPTDADRAKAAALDLARKYFESEYVKTIGQRIESEVEVTAAEQVQGWGDRWRVNGTALLRFQRETPLTQAEQDSINPDYIANRSLSARELRRRELRLRYVRTEFVRFEGLVTHLDTNPEFEVTKHESAAPRPPGTSE